MSQSHVAASGGSRAGEQARAPRAAGGELRLGEPRDVPTSTALGCADWQAFAGPGARWARALERMEAEAESRVAAAVSGALHGEAFADVSPGWLRFLQDNMPVAAFAFNECGRLLDSLSRRSPWGGIADGLALQASMQFRQAQSIVLYVADMEQRLGAMPMQTARTRWKTDRQWLPAHHFLEQAATCPDWAEALVAINLCFEPLAGQLLRREVAMRLAPAHGDHVTGVVAAVGQDEWSLTRVWTASALAFVLADAEHGEENHALLQTWLARHLPLAQDAARHLGDLAGTLDAPAAASDAFQRVLDDQHALLADVGLVAA